MRIRPASDEVYSRLKDALERGVYSFGGKLPGERALAENFSVSRETLRHALERLESDGALFRSAQRGWFVPRPTIGEPPSTLQSFTEMARQRGLIPSASVLERRVRPATLEEAGKLGIAPSAAVLWLARLRGMSGTPVCVDTNVLPLAVAAGLEDVDFTDMSLYELLEKRCGIRIYRSSYSVQAEACTVDLAPLLGMPVGAPVLVGREVAYTEHGQPVLLGLNTYRGDAYRFGADLYRASR